MKQIVVLSLKGGTGKTTLAAGLAHLAVQELRLVLADADVDAANLEMVLAPTRVAEHDFRAGSLAVIDEDTCIACGVCEQICRFDAIEPGDECFAVIANACEGCAACFYQCPAEAIAMQERLQGIWFHSQTRYGDLFHAHLFAGQENSGSLVTLVKQQANLWGLDHGVELALVDGPRGTGMPAMAAAAGAHLVVLVVEPALSAAAELERALATMQRLGLGVAVVISKHDLNPAQTIAIEQDCARLAIPLLGRIPFDTAVTAAMVQGQPVTVGAPDSAAAREMASIWRKLDALL
jgi:MinD superfamily P-loop ATPase